jgi:hypothetical protein
LRRTELYACALALAFAGCMKIYPDPELPDIDVTWSEGDCDADTFQVAMSLASLDSPASPHIDKTVPCLDAKYTFVDVAREQFHLDGTLLDDAGAMAGSASGEVDLRNGFDSDAFLYFGGFDNFQVPWVFDATSCTELGADTVSLVFSVPMGVAFIITQPCEAGFFSGILMPGIYTLHAEARANGAVVATSPETPELTIMDNGFTVSGLLVLTACGAMCP